ncbi:MAG: hypothetical protein M0Z46_04885 [Actinomycetota bacterium]|jgi:hypothetical protein|nr:hypothetical protein [Actinomycetota bacterium]
MPAWQVREHEHRPQLLGDPDAGDREPGEDPEDGHREVDVAGQHEPALLAVSDKERTPPSCL